MLKIGQVIGILNPLYNDGNNGERRYIKHKVISIVKKNKYNMYICENIQTKTRTTVTDIDVITSKTARATKAGYKNKIRPIIKFYKNK